MMDLDEILQEIGEFGKYQIRNYLLVCLPVFFSAANSLTYVFTAAVPRYRCFIPNCDDELNPVYDDLWVPNAIPAAKGKGSDVFEPDHCLYYQQQNASGFECSEVESFGQETLRCDRWVFDSGERSIVNDWLITCLENQPKLALVGSMHFAGIAFGTVLFGFLADTFGRKLIFVVSIILMAAAGSLQIIAGNLFFFYLFEFLKSVGTAGVYPLAFVLGVEMVGKNKREMASIALNYFYAVGEAAVGLIAWISGDWQILQATMAIPPFLFIAYYWFLPESARWLIARGDQHKAKKIIKIAAETNNKTIPNLDDIQLGIPESEKHSKSSGNVLQTFKAILQSKIMLIRLLVLFYSWSANAFVYYGLSLSSVNLSGNKYFNFMLVALIGIPGYAIAMHTMNSIGRKASIVGAMMISGLTCISGAFLEGAPSWLTVVLYLLGKMCITASFGILYCYTTEVLPTIIRSGGVGTLSTSARFAALLAPFVPLLENIETYLPLLLFGIVALVGALLMMLLPETSGYKLPNTVEEAEAMERIVKKDLESTRL